MTVINVYAQSNMNWNTPDGWNTVAGGGGTAYTDPQNGGGNNFICDLNGKIVQASGVITVDVITENDATSRLEFNNSTVANIINAQIAYSGSNTSPGFLCNRGTNLSINGEVLCGGTSAGYAVFASGTVNNFNNGSGVVITKGTNSTTGRAVYHYTGSLAVSGDIRNIESSSAASYAIYSISTGSKYLKGNVICTGGEYNLFSSAGDFTWDIPTTGYNISRINGGTYPIYTSGGNMTWIGSTLNCMEAIITGTLMVYLGSSGSFTWVGKWIIPEGSMLYMAISPTLILATATDYLDLENYGSLCIVKQRFDVRGVTITAAGGTASIKNMSQYASTSIMGVDNATRSIITRHTTKTLLNFIKI